MDKKITIEVSEQCAEEIKWLNDPEGENRAFKLETIANALARLAGMLQAGRDDEGLAVHAPDIINTMACLGEYYDLIIRITHDAFREGGQFLYKPERIQP